MTKTQSEALVAVISKAVTEALVLALSSGEAVTEATTEGCTIRQSPKSNSKARRSATPTAPASNVRRLTGFFEAKTSTTAASLRKGHVFCLKTGGAMYTVTSVLRTANTVTVATDHPKVEQMTLASEKPVTFCMAK